MNTQDSDVRQAVYLSSLVEIVATMASACGLVGMSRLANWRTARDAFTAPVLVLILTAFGIWAIVSVQATMHRRGQNFSLSSLLVGTAHIAILLGLAQGLGVDWTLFSCALVLSVMVVSMSDGVIAGR